ncbi:MAG TPA: Xaa-Pro peptidase family protein [Gemmatimonadales bacterium]|jgi:Xaa-Pro dipeptidase|nr:Xaa-Pro peptidase family protein [Gemmatimonadales bacterium]
MDVDRRGFAGLTAGWLGALAIGPRGRRGAVATEPPCPSLPPAIEALKPMTAGIQPITDDERHQRLARAQDLMQQQGLAGMVLEPGTSLYYYTGMQWGLSERPFVGVVPARGDLAWVCPAFEEARARELIRFGKDVRVWQEDDSPYEVIAGILRDRGGATGKIGFEERVRFFVMDGVRQVMPQAAMVSATPVTAGCRMFKSPAEIALMQRANDITVAGMKAAFGTLKEGMTPREFGANAEAAFRRLGGSSTWSLVGFGKFTAFPHGSIQPQQLREGDVVLLDAGCAVEHYESDITRTTVFGKPTARQTEIWNLERKAQDAAFAAAQLGATCGSVDDAARKVITDAGFGPGYQVPGLPHRTGHGIGLDGHEWTNFVRGNQTKLQPGMCFSDEPTIAIYGEFGIRLEDCLHMTDSGPKFFSEQSPAVDRPFV